MKRISAAGLWLIFFAFALFSGGCATFSGPAAVSVSVVEVMPTQTSLLELSARLTLRLTNESPQPIVLAGSAHRLFVNGSYVGRAVSNERLTIPQFGTATQAVTVYLENLTLIGKVAELSRATAPRISYRLDSKLHSAAGEGRGHIATTSTGELDLSGWFNGTLGEGQTP